MVAERYGISEQTVWKWRKRDSVLYQGPVDATSVLALGLSPAAATGGLAAPASSPQIIPQAGGNLLVLP